MRRDEITRQIYVGRYYSVEEKKRKKKMEGRGGKGGGGGGKELMRLKFGRLASQSRYNLFEWDWLDISESVSESVVCF